MLLDEPAAGITGAEVERLVGAHPADQPERAPVIVVDHDMEFVRMLGSRITVFHQGAILIEGPADQVLADPRVREVYIGNRRMSTDAATDADAARRRVARAPTRRTSCSRSPTCAPATATCRCCTACRSQLHEGEALGIVGHNGMGKTTLLQDARWACCRSTGGRDLGGRRRRHARAGA